MTLSTRHPLIARRPPVLSGVIGIAVAIVVYLLVLLADKTLWTLEATKQDFKDAEGATLLWAAAVYIPPDQLRELNFAKNQLGRQSVRLPRLSSWN